MSTKVNATRQQKREQAKERQTIWDKLSPQQRLASLKIRPGHSKKERARLTAKP